MRKKKSLLCKICKNVQTQNALSHKIAQILRVFFACKYIFDLSWFFHVNQALLVIQQDKSNSPQTIWHRFSAQFAMLSQMVCSVLLSVLHFKTKYLEDLDWLLKISHQSAAGSTSATKWEKWKTPSERAFQTENWKTVPHYLWHFIWQNLLYDKWCNPMYVEKTIFHQYYFVSCHYSLLEPEST